MFTLSRQAIYFANNNIYVTWYTRHLPEPTRVWLRLFGRVNKYGGIAGCWRWNDIFRRKWYFAIVVCFSWLLLKYIKICSKACTDLVFVFYFCCIYCSSEQFCSGVVSNISQCQIALNWAIARARSRKVLCATVYLIFISLLTLCLGS